MSYQLLPLTIFAISSCATPGPNTILLATCGANFGFKSTLPYSAGVILGRIILQIMVICFLGVFFVHYPYFQQILKVIGSLYLFYLSYKLLTSKALSSNLNRDSPLSFINGLLFQFINPKVWTNTTTAVSSFTYGLKDFYLHATLIVFVFAIISLLANSMWALCGVQIRRFIRSPKSLFIFNVSMALLNTSCIVLIWTIG
jgi:threonine/homoserine/homoserine lactone efflux protein